MQLWLLVGVAANSAHSYASMKVKQNTEEILTEGMRERELICGI